MNLVGRPFAETFTFRRPRLAQVRDSSGAPVVSALNRPRFDHDADGNPLGLLIEAGETVGLADRCELVDAGWSADEAATVFHEYADKAGRVVRRAYYTRHPRATVNALLRTEGHHRTIGAVPGYQRLQDGAVRFRDGSWPLAGLLGVARDGPVLGDSTDQRRPLLAG